MSKRATGIPHPVGTVQSLLQTTQALKDRVEQSLDRSGDLLTTAVTFNDLLTLGLIKSSDLAQIRRRERNPQ